MARVAGVSLPTNKRLEVALTYIYGVGRSTSNQVLENLKIDRNKKVKDLSEADIDRIRDELKKYKLEGERRREVAMNIKRLSDISCYRGIRHNRRLPVRGQRTKTNSRTRKGRKRTIANKKKD